MTMNILRLSTDLQSELIKNLAAQADLTKQPNYLVKMLDSIVAKASEVLKADACSIYLIDNHMSEHNGERQATMRAATGYQEIAVDKAICRVLPAEKIPRYSKLGLTSWVISTGRSFLAESPDKLVQHPYWSGEYDKDQLPDAQLKPAAFLAVPLRSPQGQIIGALKAERLPNSSTAIVNKQIAPETLAHSNTVFTVNNQIALETLARVAGRCITYIDNALSGQLDAAITAWTLDVIAEAVAAEGELDAFLDIVARATAAATSADSCAVFLIDESKATLTQRAGCGSQVLRKVIRSYRLPDSTQLVNCENPRICTPAECAYRADLPYAERVGVTAWVAATGKSYHARNFEELRKHCHHRGQYDGPNYQSDQQCGAWLGVPLLVGGTIVGVLKIENISMVGVLDERDFTPDIQQRLDVLAQDIALAIQRLQIQSPARYEVIQKAMPSIFEILRGELDVRKLVERVVGETAKLFDARACALFLKEGNQLIQPPWAAYGWAQRGPQVRKYDLVRPDQVVDNPTPDQKVGLTVWIAVKKTNFTAKSNLELTSHPHHKGTFDEHNFNEEERCESFMGTPLLFGKEKELVGVLKVETKQRSVEAGKEVAYFNEQDELVFELIAKSAAIAIQNARLLESRGLAERLISLPYLDQVMSALHEFIRARVEVVSTLESTANVVRGEDRTKADAIQSFASLLEPNFSITILEQLASQMRGPLNDLLSFFVAAIRAEVLEEIRTLPLKTPQVAGLLRADFFMHECAAILFDTLREVDGRLEQYAQEQTQRVALLDCLILLDKRRSQIETMDLFEKSVLGRIFSIWREIVQTAFIKFHPVLNPYMPGMPLQANSPVFVGREDVFRWIQDNLHNQTQKNALILHGGWHTGKTSILYQIESGIYGQQLRERRNRPVYPVFVDLQVPVGSIYEFLVRIAIRIKAALHARDIQCPQPADDGFRTEPYLAFDRFLEEVVRVITEKADGLLAIMLDEFEILDDIVKQGKIDGEVFRYLRSIMQHQRSVTFILAGRHRLDEMTLEYRNILFNVALHHEVGFLTPTEARSLIRNPMQDSAVTYEEAVVERILGLSGNHPYFIQQLCFNCVDLLNSRKQDYQITESLLEDALGRALKHNMVLQSLWSEKISKEDQVVLRTLAELQSSTGFWIPFAKIVPHSGMTDDQASQSLQTLHTQQLIAQRQLEPGTEKCYCYRIDMLRLWVAQQ